VVVVVVALLAALAGGCSGHSSAASSSSGSATTARALTSEEADRLAVARFNAYRAKMLVVSGTIVGGTASTDVTVRGWVDTVNGEGYAAVATSGGGHFLTVWNGSEISAQDYTGGTPPLPRPQTGWSTTDLKSGESALATGQLVLLGISSDRPDNPQLLVQGNAHWLGSDTVDGVRVDIMSGPLATGATVSNLRYWVDGSGQLRRLQARLDGRNWSTFDFATASNVTF
jgi:hypothetical protein